jgi:hypothetical protein
MIVANTSAYDYENAGGIRALRISNNEFSLASFGALGGANQTSLIQNAVDTVTALGGGTLVGHKGVEYAVDSAVGITGSNVVFKEAAFDLANNPGKAFEVSGSYSSLSLAQDTLRGSTQVVFQSNHNRQPGDYIVLRSGSKFFYPSSSTPFTEWVRVAEVIDATTVNLAAPTLFSYEVATGSSGELMTLVENVRFTDCSARGIAANQSSFVTFSATKGCGVTRGKFVDLLDRVAGHSRSIANFDENYSVVNTTNQSGGLIYGTVFGRQTQDCVANNLFGDGIRHVVAMGGSGGLVIRCHEEGTRSINSMAGMDQHGQCYGCSHSNVKVHMSHLANVNEDGGSVNGSHVFIDNVEFTNSKRHGLTISPQTADLGGAPNAIRATNVRIDGSTENGISMNLDGGGSIDSIDLSCHVTNASKRSLLIEMADVGIGNISVSGLYQTNSDGHEGIQIKTKGNGTDVPSHIDLDVVSEVGSNSSANNIKIENNSGLTANGAFVKAKCVNGGRPLRVTNRDATVVTALIAENFSGSTLLDGSNNSNLATVNF